MPFKILITIILVALVGFGAYKAFVPQTSPVTVVPPVSTTTPITTPAPMPISNPPLTVVTQGDFNQTVALAKGEQFVIALGGSLKWSLSFIPSGIIQKVSDVSGSTTAQGIYQADETGTSALHATGAPICKAGEMCPDFLQEVMINFVVR